VGELACRAGGSGASRLGVLAGANEWVSRPAGRGGPGARRLCVLVGANEWVSWPAGRAARARVG